MRKGICVLVALLALISAKSFFEAGSTHNRWSMVETAGAQTSACNFPTAMDKDPAQTSWRFFVAANCKATSGQLTWETWTEQTTLYAPTGQATATAQRAGNHRLHASGLAQIERQKLRPGTAQTTTNCPSGSMQAPPKGLAATCIGEEVYLNPAAANFITDNKYQARAGQTSAAKSGTNIQFPPAAVEIKVDWIPASDFKTPFNCTNPPAGLHVETINGTCQALVGMHIISKLIGQWMWATFEPQSMTTNPGRCITFGPCNDSWGSTPPNSNGGASGFTQPTADLTNLMKEANLPAEFLNYRLVGVQTSFLSDSGANTILGNSIIEGENVGQAPMTSSCITCHSVSSIKNDGTDGATLLKQFPNPPVGAPFQVPTGWVARDFVWSMAFACPNGAFGANCGTSPPAAKK